MGRRFVDMRVIRDRMDRQDVRRSREARARVPLQPEVGPVVEVTIIRQYPDGPVVEVWLEPVDPPTKIDGAK